MPKGTKVSFRRYRQTMPRSRVPKTISPHFIKLKEVEPKIQKGGNHMLHHLTHSKPMNQVHAHMARDKCAVQRQRPRQTSLGQTKMPSEAPKGVQASRKVTEKAGHMDECNNVTPLPPVAF